MSETWRVVLESGEVRSISVQYFGDNDYTGGFVAGADNIARHLNPQIHWTFKGGSDSEFKAIMNVAHHEWYVGIAEILRPGDPTRAELLATAAGVAERVRVAAVEACAARAESSDVASRTAYYVSAADDAAARRDEANACTDAIRALDLAAIVRGAP